MLLNENSLQRVRDSVDSFLIRKLDDADLTAKERKDRWRVKNYPRRTHLFRDEDMTETWCKIENYTQWGLANVTIVSAVEETQCGKCLSKYRRESRKNEA